jgi:spore coat protein U-like protein
MQAATFRMIITPSPREQNLMRRSRGWFFVAAAACILALAPIRNGPTALAATRMSPAHGSGVSASVAHSCGATATPLAFGPYTGVLVVATATVTVNCTETTPYAVGLDAGSSTGATVTTRSLTGPGGAKLAYGLFQDKPRTINWGDTMGVDTHRGVGNSRPQTLTVYAAEPAGQYPTPGHYADTIMITVSF